MILCGNTAKIPIILSRIESLFLIEKKISHRLLVFDIPFYHEHIKILFEQCILYVLIFRVIFRL